MKKSKKSKRIISTLLASALTANLFASLLVSLPAAAAPARRLGDVDGDGMLTPHDAMIIINSSVGIPTILDTCPDARAAASIRTNPGEGAGINDAMAILRIIVGLDSRLPSNNPLTGLWADSEIDLFYLTDNYRFAGTICQSRRRVLYTSLADIPKHEFFSVGIAQPESVRSFVASEALYNFTPLNGGNFSGFMGTFTEDQPAGTVMGFQPFQSDGTHDIRPVPEDFALHDNHREEVIVWTLCNCYYNGGGFGFGRVTDRYDEPHTEDAIAILRFAVRLSNPIDDCAHARMAANIITPGHGNPSVLDAIEILRYVVGLPSRLDEFYE